MRRINLMMTIFVLLGLVSCQQNETKESEMKTEANILLQEFDTPYGVPPFEKIKTSDYRPAYKVAIAELQAEIKAIVENKEKPTFENTI